MGSMRHAGARPTTGRGGGALRPSIAFGLVALLATSCSDGGGITVSGAVSGLRFASQPEDVRMGETFTVAVELITAAGERATGATDVVSLVLSPAGSLEGTTSVAAVGGLATFNGLSVPDAGTDLRLTASSGSLSVQSDRFAVTDPCVTLAGAVPLGQSVSGALSQGDCTDPDGRFSQLWGFNLTAPTNIQIDLTSNQFDAFLALLDLDFNLIAADDDGGDGTNARIIVDQLSAGTFLIIVTSFGPGETGAYQLSLRVRDPCEPKGTIGLGQTVGGTLTTASCLVDDAFFTDFWRLDLNATTTVQIDLTSEDFDAFLILRELDGSFIDDDDDGGTGTDARIVRNLPAGSYLIEASTAFSEETGDYELRVIQTAGGIVDAGAQSPPGAARAGRGDRRSTTPR